MTGMPHDDRVPSIDDAVEVWTAITARYLAQAIRHPDDIAGTGITRDMLASTWAGVGGVILRADPDHLMDDIADHGHAQVVCDLPDPGPLPLSTLAVELRRAWADYLLAHSMRTGSLSSIEAALAAKKSTPDSTVDPWVTARRLFPRVPVPWEHMAISESIQQLARAGAVNPAPLPGAVMAILAGIIGRAADVSPKSGWIAPLIVWHADIRDSGDGKTHSPRTLIKTMYDWQRDEDDRYRREQQAYEALPAKEKKDAEPPTPARSYFATDITLEGLRSALDGHPTGGITILLDELSSFFSGQNQYKNGKGSDRESWLCLHDGNPARVIRAGKSCYIHGGRVQLYGGIQPAVLRQSVTSKNGIYLDDGTVFRFLFTFSRSSFHELTGESWSHDHREQWASILSSARAWADQHVEDTWHMGFDRESRKYFMDWRNELESVRGSLPQEIRGFIPKAIGYVLRFAGIIHCLNRFARGQEPLALLRREDLDSGIAFVMFYLGQTVDALHYLVGATNKSAIDMTDTRIVALAETLAKIEPDVESGRVAIGHVHAVYNDIAPGSDRFGSPHAMGAFLRSIGLTIPDRKYNWRNRRGIRCLSWDTKTKTLMKTCPHCPHCPPIAQPCGLVDN